MLAALVISGHCPRASAQTAPGSALRFDGVDDILMVGGTSLIRGAFSVEMWVRPASSSAFFGMLGSRFPGEYSFDMKVYQGSLIHGDIGNGAAWATTAADAPYTYAADSWFHIAYVVVSDRCTIYVNGAPIATNSYPSTLALLRDADHQLVIGASAYDDFQSVALEPFGGEIDEVRIWSVGLGPLNIANNWNHSLALPQNNLAAYFRFDENTGGVANDLTGNGNHAFFVNDPQWVASGSYASATVTTLVASASLNSATLKASINPQGKSTTAWFEWGTTTSYGNITPMQSVASVQGNVNVEHALASLTTGSLYHYRAVASNFLGIVRGDDQTFRPSFFSPISTTLLDFSGSAVAWGDYDNDGDLDILIGGNIAQNPGYAARIYRNDGSGQFADINANLPGSSQGSVAWGDFDNDGDLDVLLSGANPCRVLRNDGGNTFVDINAGLPSISYGSAVWGDYDSDGKLDILLTGDTGSLNNRITRIYRNAGANVFTDINAVLPGYAPGLVAWADYDSDGDLDFAAAGRIGNGSFDQAARVYRNNGSAVFTESGLHSGSEAATGLDWGDVDADGKLDLAVAIAGGWSLYRNIGDGALSGAAYAPNPNPEGSLALGDFDNDGDLDLFMAGGATFTTPFTGVFRAGGPSFPDVNAGLEIVIPGFFQTGKMGAWGDYDNDGRLDLLVSGYSISANGPSTRVYRNNRLGMNTPTTAPTDLYVTTPSGGAVIFNWSPSFDEQSPSLTYNLRVGTAPGLGDIVSPMAAANGYRRVPAMGNQFHRTTTTLRNLAPSRTYFWSVQAIDSAFVGSPFAEERTFTLLANGKVSPPGDVNGDGIVSESELNLVLANYFPTSPWLYITNTAGLGTATVSFALSNSTAGAFTVEYTTNLTDWIPLGPAIPRYEFLDTNAPSSPQRQYRLRWP